MRKLKLYIETSVWNFFFAGDAPEKMDITKEFFDSVQKGFYEVYVSGVVLREVNNAPKDKKDRLIRLINQCAPIRLDIVEEAEKLASIYLDKKIVPVTKINDALHIGIATAFEMDAVVTWNYRHLANLRKAELFYSANLEAGYFKRIEIVTPMEVIRDES
jgi:predicted nucleic acid-binding protein